MVVPRAPEGTLGHKRKLRPGREHSIRTSGKPGYGRNLADGVWKLPSFKLGPLNCWNTRTTGCKSASRKGIYLQNLLQNRNKHHRRPLNAKMVHRGLGELNKETRDRHQRTPPNGSANRKRNQHLRRVQQSCRHRRTYMRCLPTSTLRWTTSQEKR